MGTTTAPIACLECGAAPVERRVAGEAFFECPSCGSVRVLRAALHRLREMASTAHPSIAELLPGAPRERAAPRALRQKRCPVCQAPLSSHAFGGGNVRVESCESCELVYLRRADLAAVLFESRDGIEMSEDARAALLQERMIGAGNRLSAAELSLSTGALVALLLFLRIVVRVGFSTSLVAAAAAIALGTLVYRRQKWRKKRSEEIAKMERLAAAEVFRLEQRDQRGARRAGEAAMAAVRSESILKPASSSRPRPCPVCNAKLPAGTSHCARCDSDFG
jgi:Zn-finger nucleic acid-binding protein